MKDNIEENTREIIVGNYRVIYDIVPLMVRNLAVLHGARSFQNPKLRVPASPAGGSTDRG
jgi:hypothetical protein